MNRKNSLLALFVLQLTLLSAFGQDVRTRSSYARPKRAADGRVRVPLPVEVAKKKANVVYLNADYDMFQNIPKQRFDVYSIVLEKTFKENEEEFSKIASEKICLVKNDKDLEGMRACLTKFLKQLKGKKIQHLINGASEDEVMLGGILRSEFAVENGMRKEEAELFVDKYKMKQKLQENDPSIPTAKFLLLSKASSKSVGVQLQKWQFPLIIKPTSLAASQGIVKVDNFKELDSFLAQFFKLPLPKRQEYIVEEFIQGKVMRIDGFVDNGDVQVAYPSVYEPSCFDFYRMGAPQVTYSDNATARKKEYNTFTQKIITALGLENGPYHLEAIRQESTQKLYFLEIGARPGGDSEFLTEFYNYPYDEVHLKSQIGIHPHPKLIPHNEKHGHAIVDCPTLPPAIGHRQQLLSFTYDKKALNADCEDSLVSLPDFKEVQDTSDAVSTVASFGFLGEEAKIKKIARKLRDSAHATYSVWDSSDDESMGGAGTGIGARAGGGAGGTAAPKKDKTKPVNKKRKRIVEWPLNELPEDHH